MALTQSHHHTLSKENSPTTAGLAKPDKMRGDTFDLAMIAPVLNAGFRAVLEEASRLRVLDPPYGRTPMPDPKQITEDGPLGASDDQGRGREGDTAGEEEQQDSEEDDAGGQVSGEDNYNDRAPRGRASGSVEHSGDKICGNQNEVESMNQAFEDDDHGDDDDDDDDDMLLEYKFEYGFNPLVFLGEYVRKHSPAATQARQDKLRDDLLYLRQRVAKCHAREEAMLELRELVAARRSGVIHGPVAGDISDCGVIVWAKTSRAGQLIVELSRHQDFHTVCRQGMTKVDQATDCTGTVEFDDLDPSTVLHHRAYLHNPRRGFHGPSADPCANGKFSTLPERDGEIEGDVRFAAFSAHGLGHKDAARNHRDDIRAACSALAGVKPTFYVILGQPDFARGATLLSKTSIVEEGFRELQETATRVQSLSKLLQENGYLTAHGVGVSLAEGLKKRHSHKETMGRHSADTSGERGGTGGGHGAKGTLPNVPSYWPMRSAEAWGSRPLGSNVEIFLMDARSGILSDDQVVWMTEAVEESSRTWKVIACGVPVGLPYTDERSQFSADPASAREHAAAATIQASLRTRIASRPAMKAAKPDTVVNNNNASNNNALGGSHTGGGEDNSGDDVGAVDGEGGGREESVSEEGGIRSDGDSPDHSASLPKVTVQMQEMVEKLHLRGCRNVVLITPAWAHPHALSFLSGHEAEGRFPIYELGCGGLLPYSYTIQNSSTALNASACQHLEPAILAMPDSSLGMVTAAKGMACSISFRREQQQMVDEGEQEVEDKLSGDVRLLFEISDACGKRLSSLTLAAVK